MPKLSQLLEEDALFNGSSVSLFNVNLFQELSLVDVLFKKLESNKKLESISLRACQLYFYDQAFLQRLFGFFNELPNLVEICLAENSLDERDRSFWEVILTNLMNPTLKTIDLESNFLFKEGSEILQGLVTFFRNHPFLRSINLRGNAVGNLGSADLRRLWDILRASELEHLNLLANNFDKMTNELFCEMLSCFSAMRHLKSLDLSFNDFTDKPLGALIDFLRYSSVEMLVLNGCNLGLMRAVPQDWEELFKIIATRNCIVKLEIHSNKLEYVNNHAHHLDRLFLMVRFSRFIGQWTRLKKLDIHNNYLEGRDDLLIYLARTLLMRNSELGLSQKYSSSRIAKDFENTGHRFNMEALIQETKKLLLEKQHAVLKLEEPQKLFLVSKPLCKKPEDQEQTTPDSIKFSKVEFKK